MGVKAWQPALKMHLPLSKLVRLYWASSGVKVIMRRRANGTTNLIDLVVETTKNAYKFHTLISSELFSS